jgi:hypothetical protein
MMLFGLEGPQPLIRGSLDVVYHLKYFYVMCCMCDDMIVVGVDIGVHDNPLYGDMWQF